MEESQREAKPLVSRRILHFVNQFFAGEGGERAAGAPVRARPGTVGPGTRLQALLGNAGDIVVTVSCGDDYFAERREEALAQIEQIARESLVELVVAGPAFASGRYGFACVEVCHAASLALGIAGVTGLHVENPAVAGYREYRDPRVFAVPTANSVTGMEDALVRMAGLLGKLASGSPIGSASEAGYIARGIRVAEPVAATGAERAVEMLLAKLACRSFVSEIPIERLDEVPVAPGVVDLGAARLALVTTAGVFPPGNPDGFRAFANTQWRKYAIQGLHSMRDARWDVLHGGYNNTFMAGNPDYGVPLDACRELEREGAFAELYPYFYGTTGVNASISSMQTLGAEIAADMRSQRIDAAVLVAT